MKVFFIDVSLSKIPSQLNKRLFNKLVSMISPTLKPQFKLYICNTILKEDNNCMYNGCYDKSAFMCTCDWKTKYFPHVGASYSMLHFKHKNMYSPFEVV